MPARNVGTGCTQSCRLKCHHHFTEDDRNQVLKSYWTLGDPARRWMFLNSSMDVNKPKRRRKRAAATKRRNRQGTTKYYLVSPSTEERIQVCKQFFVQTLNISDSPLKTARGKQTNTGSTTGDLRGNIPRELPTEEELSCDTHIQTYSTVESHYVRKDTKWQFLPASLSIAKMYRSYILWCNQQNPKIKPAKNSTYRMIFRENYKLKFHKPKKDQCDKCFAFNRCPVPQRTP